MPIRPASSSPRLLSPPAPIHQPDSRSLFSFALALSENRPTPRRPRSCPPPNDELPPLLPLPIRLTPATRRAGPKLKKEQPREKVPLPDFQDRRLLSPLLLPSPAFPLRIPISCLEVEDLCCPPPPSSIPLPSLLRSSLLLVSFTFPSRSRPSPPFALPSLLLPQSELRK